MTELKQEHFEVIDKNKQKYREEQRDMKDQLAVFVLIAAFMNNEGYMMNIKDLKKTNKIELITEKKSY